MHDVHTLHDTVVVRREYDAPPARVFAAWRDAAALKRWYVPGDASWSSRVVEHEFRRGGVKRLEFGPPGELPYEEDCRYEDIVPERRLCFSMAIRRGGTPITASLVTVEFQPSGTRTRISVTDQLAILDVGESAAARERGWEETLGKLTGELAA